MPDRAAVPNATVTLKNEATGQVLTTQSTGNGDFSFPNTLGGDYTVTATASGFQEANEKVKVLLNQESSVNVVLKPAGVSGVVEVTSGGETLVQTETSQVGSNFETRQVQDLPIFNDVRALALLSPNVVAQGVGVAGDGGSVGGTRPHANAFNVDGVDNNAPDLTGDHAVPSQDHRCLRRSKINAGAKRACLSRCKRRTGSLSAEPGADVEHDSDAGAGRRAGDGALGDARV